MAASQPFSIRFQNRSNIIKGILSRLDMPSLKEVQQIADEKMCLELQFHHFFKQRWPPVGHLGFGEVQNQ